MPKTYLDEQGNEIIGTGSYLDEQGNAAQPNLEEQRAERVRTASPQELRKIHFGENVPAGARAEQVSPVAEYAQGALVDFPARALASVPQIPNLLYQSITKPAQVGKQVAKAPAEIYRKMSEGTPRETGAATMEALTTALPMAKVGGAAGEIVKKGIQSGAASGARRLISSVVKPSLKDQAFTKDPTGAVLKHRIIGNSEKSMLDNVEGVVKKLDDDVGNNIAKSGAQVSPAEVNGILENTISRIASNVGETNAPGIITKLRGIQERIMSQYGDRNLSLPEVHALRREIDDTISFTEDAVDKGVNKAKYEFRTGLNNIIEKHVPGVKATNMDVASLLSAKEALRRRINTGQNASILPGPIGLGAEVAGTLMGAPGAYTAAHFAKKGLESTAVKSRAAQMLESMSGQRKPVTPIPPPGQRQLPYRTGPDTSGVTPMSQQGAGAQFEAVSQGMGAGRPGQRQLPAFGETEGSTYQALVGRDVNLNQRLLNAAPDIQLEGGFSQLSEIQPSIEKLQVPLRQDVMAGQGYNPNQLFQGGRMADPAQQLQKQRMHEMIELLTPEQLNQLLGGQ